MPVLAIEDQTEAIGQLQTGCNVTEDLGVLVERYTKQKIINIRRLVVVHAIVISGW